VFGDRPYVFAGEPLEWRSSFSRRLELRSVESRESLVGAKPHPAFAVLENCANVFRREIGNRVPSYRLFVDGNHGRDQQLKREFSGDARRDEHIVAILIVAAQRGAQLIRSRREPPKVSIAILIRWVASRERANGSALLAVEADGHAA